MLFNICQFIAALLLVPIALCADASQNSFDNTLIFVKSLKEQRKQKLGVLRYDGGAQEALFIPDAEIKGEGDVLVINDKFVDQDVCIGYEGESGFECFSYRKLKNPLKGQFVIHTKPDNTPLSYDYIASALESKASKPTKKGKKSSKRNSSSKNADFAITAIVSKSSIGSKPSLKAPEIKPKKTKEEVKKELEEENKSFFQKYWMYILPIAIILLMGGGGQQQGGN